MVVNHTLSEFSEDETEACRRVLIELTNIFSQFEDHMALVGGWVPFFLIEQRKEKHVGTLDVDLFFDCEKIGANSYETIEKILLDNNYYRPLQGKGKFQWVKEVAIEGKFITVTVDLLCGEYEEQGKRKTLQEVQDVKLRTARGSDLIFQSKSRCIKKSLSGRNIRGFGDTVTINVANGVAFLIMKGMAIGRGKSKDAYDIVYTIEHYDGGIDQLVEEFQQDIEHGLVKEGLTRIRHKFGSATHVGPNDVADFRELKDPEQRELCFQRSFQIVDELLSRLGF